MELAIINGSPRGLKSNSRILINHFLEGFHSIENIDVNICYLVRDKQGEDATALFSNAEVVIIVFPLYTDCMPGIVKEFFERVYDLNSYTNKKVGFIVQSGFPEAIHSIFLERYLRKLTDTRLKCEYLGTIIKGGVEGIQAMPQAMTKYLFRKFYELGAHFAKTGLFSTRIMEELRKPIRFSFTRKIIYNLLKLTGLTNLYWNSNLKKHGAYARRFDKPLLIEK